MFLLVPAHPGCPGQRAVVVVVVVVVVPELTILSDLHNLIPMLHVCRVGCHCTRVLKVSTRGTFTEGSATVGIVPSAARRVQSSTSLSVCRPITAGHFSN